MLGSHGSPGEVRSFSHRIFFVLVVCAVETDEFALRFSMLLKRGLGTRKSGWPRIKMIRITDLVGFGANILHVCHQINYTSFCDVSRPGVSLVMNSRPRIRASWN